MSDFAWLTLAIWVGGPVVIGVAALADWLVEPEDPTGCACLVMLGWLILAMAWGAQALFAFGTWTGLIGDGCCC